VNGDYRCGAINLIFHEVSVIKLPYARQT
jgi:hypothetical protein